MAKNVSDFELIKADFAALPGWMQDNHASAFSCFLKSSERMVKRAYTTKRIGVDGKALAKIGKIALEQNDRQSSPQKARQFFERHFDPFFIQPKNSAGKSIDGLVTAYYEPEVCTSAFKTEKFKYPVYRRPDDLVDVSDKNRPANLDQSFAFARQSKEGLCEYYDRKQIESGALEGRGLELFWFESLVDIFFIHIQGSARLILEDGTIKRISYAAKTGHPFSAIGRLLVQRGELQQDTISMQSIKKWLADHPEKAQPLMWENRSFIFFYEVDHNQPDMGPIAAASVALTPGRSLAIDHRLHSFGTPVFIATKAPLRTLANNNAQPFRRLMVAQDTGSAIIGPARGDLFMGSGDLAGELAGAVVNKADFFLLKPKPEYLK